MNKKFNLAERFKKPEMPIEKEVAEDLINNKELEEANQAITEIVAEAALEKSIEETIKEATKTGSVIGCAKLNVRFTPKKDGSIIGILSAGDKVEVDGRFYDEEFYKITMPLGLEGYCMKKYIFIE